jgi:hypothetical protein
VRESNFGIKNKYHHSLGVFNYRMYVQMKGRKGKGVMNELRERKGRKEQIAVP